VWSLVSFKGTLKTRFFLWVLFFALLVGMSPTNSDNDKFSWFILAILTSYSTLVMQENASKVYPKFLPSRTGVSVQHETLEDRSFLA
jgi:hypothetical protein